MDEDDTDPEAMEFETVGALWTSGLPMERILQLEAEMDRRQPPRDAGLDASVIRDHTPGDLDEWLAGKDVATRPAPHEPRIVSWERH